MGSNQVDISSAKSAEVTMRTSDGESKTIIRKSLRDVFCTRCGQSVGEEGMEDHRCTFEIPIAEDGFPDVDQSPNGWCDVCKAPISDNPTGGMRFCSADATHDCYGDGFNNGGDPFEHVVSSPSGWSYISSQENGDRVDCQGCGNPLNDDLPIKNDEKGYAYHATCLQEPVYPASRDNNRGFSRGKYIQTYKGCGRWRLRESSNASIPCLWLDLSEPQDLNAAVIAHATGNEVNYKDDYTIQLSVSDARMLRNALDQMLTEHYHGDVSSPNADLEDEETFN